MSTHSSHVCCCIEFRGGRSLIDFEWSSIVDSRTGRQTGQAMGVTAWLGLQRRWLWATAACVIVVVIAARHGLDFGDTREIVAHGYSNVPWMPEVFIRYTTQQTRTVQDGDWSTDAGIDTTELPGLTSDMGCMNLQNLDRDKALVLGHRQKQRGFLTIGITTVERQNASYLYQTLDSLIENANATERSRMTIVVFACDFKDSGRREARDVVLRFPQHLESGFLQLVEAPRSFYPPLALRDLKRTFGNPGERVYWRSKENVDNAFLFAYAVNSSDYYMQLDDDFSTVPGYASAIRQFVEEHRSERWALLDVSEKGTGKLFRDADLLHVARYLVHFYQEQPVDFLFSALMRLHRQGRHYVIKPLIFTHLGQVSSLELKNNKARDVHHRR